MTEQDLSKLSESDLVEKYVDLGLAASAAPLVDLTQQGVLAVQLRVAERLKRLLAKGKVRLDPGSPIWFDGRMELPRPGEPWKLTLSSHGTTTSIELTPAELDAFLAAWRTEVVSQKLGRALDALRPKQ